MEQQVRGKQPHLGLVQARSTPNEIKHIQREDFARTIMVLLVEDEALHKEKVRAKTTFGNYTANKFPVYCFHVG